MPSSTRPRRPSPGRTWPGASLADARPPLLGEVPRQGPEERLLAVVVPVDPEPLRGGIRDLHERELGDAERADLDVDQDEGVPIVTRCPELDACPALLGRRVRSGAGDAPRH